MRLKFQFTLTNTLFYKLTSLTLLTSLVVLQAQAAVSWLPVGDIQAGEIVVYTGPQLANSNTLPVAFTLPISLSPPAPLTLGFGINLFHVPNDQDFSIITNKTYNITSFTVKVYLKDDTVCQQLRINYIAMASSSQIFRLLTDCNFGIQSAMNPTIISQSYGFRSETDILHVDIISDPFFTSTSLSSILVIEGIRVDPFGIFSFVDSLVTTSTDGLINATFYTFEEITISYIAYSIVFFDPKQAATKTQLVFQLGSIELSHNSSTASSFFSSILGRYTTAAGRMFFGFSSFNFTIAATKKFGFHLSSFNNLYSTYSFTNSISTIKLSYFFFVQRNCASGLYFYYNYANPSLDDCVATCSVYNDRPTNDNTYYQCLPCHFSCLTCTSSAANACLSCDATSYRSMLSGSCNCVSNYVEVGIEACALCSSKMTGCQSCSNASTCTICLPGFTGPPCTCPTASIITGHCNTVYGCTNISNFNTTQICINCNTSLLLELTAEFICACIQGTMTMGDRSCQPLCGDNYVLTVEGCDDGNLVNGDGCSSSCTVDQNWVCVGKLSQGSTCKINTTVQLTYMGATRDTSSNTAILYYHLTPTFSQYTLIDYSHLLFTTLNHSNIQLQFTPEHNLLIARVQYREDIENQEHQFELLLNNSQYFWHPTNQVKPTLSGINCELTFDYNFSVRQGLYYTLLVLLLLSFLVFIISCLFFEKWIGLQLIQTYQTYYFLLALLKQFPFELSPFSEAMKFSEGQDGILGSDFYGTYGLPKHLLALTVQKQFIANFNTMYLVILGMAIVLVVLGLRKRHYKLKLQEVISSEINKKLKKSERWLAFGFSSFMMSVFFSLFKIIFSLCIQLNNDQSTYEHFPDELNVSTGILAFVILFSMISYVLYWYLLLPDNFTDEQEFMYLRFQNMKFSYPIVYLAYQALFILALSILMAKTYVVYILLVMQVGYLVGLLVYRPYNTLRRLNRFLHNSTIVFNQLSTIFCLCVVMRWNAIIGSDYQQHSEQELTVYSFLMMCMLMISLGLAIFRLAIFNKEVSFDCLKKQEVQEMQQIDYNSMKRMENDRKEEFYKEHHKNIEMAIVNNFRIQSDHKKKPTEYNISEAQIEGYLNSNPVHWNRQSLIPSNGPKVTHQNIKKSNNSKKADLMKSSVDLYLQSKKTNNQDKAL